MSCKVEFRKLIPWTLYSLFFSFFKLSTSSHMSPKLKVEFHFRASCNWISKALCPVKFAVDFSWDPALTTIVATDLSFFSWLSLHSRYIPHAHCGLQGSVWASLCQLLSTHCAHFYTFGSIWSLIFFPFVECMSKSPTLRTLPGLFFLPYLSSSFFCLLSGLTLSVIMHRAFHKFLRPDFWRLGDISYYDFSNFTLLFV